MPMNSIASTTNGSPRSASKPLVFSPLAFSVAATPSTRPCTQSGWVCGGQTSRYGTSTLSPVNSRRSDKPPTAIRRSPANVVVNGAPPGKQRHVDVQPLRTGRRSLHGTFVAELRDRRLLAGGDDDRHDDQRGRQRADHDASLGARTNFCSAIDTSASDIARPDERADTVEPAERTEVVEKALQRGHRDQRDGGDARRPRVQHDARGQREQSERQPADRIGQVLRDRHAKLEHLVGPVA